MNDSKKLICHSCNHVVLSDLSPKSDSVAVKSSKINDARARAYVRVSVYIGILRQQLGKAFVCIDRKMQTCVLSFRKL